jgi:xylulose-5-phosphate/fructose-6-phosphate phosphoketolase
MNEDLKYDALIKYVRAANYLVGSQIYLHDNFLLEKELERDHIKNRLLGHWGSCPGVNFLYAHMNVYIKEHKQKAIFLLGPGHAFPALQANLFMEGTLADFYPKAQRDFAGLSYISKGFSTPYAFPSHSSPITPGVILEGGELGYSLSTAWGAVLDNPEVTAVCMIGDGEAETGALATAWHIPKLINSKTNGVVLPVLHLNGYKISGPTLFGRMENQEIISFFSGLGYSPLIVDVSEYEITDKGAHKLMQEALERSFSLIKKCKETGDTKGLPVIILRSPKGWSGIKEFGGNKIEGNALSHQVVCMEAKEKDSERALVENWLRSYKIQELFDKELGFCKEILEIIPEKEYCMGRSSLIPQEGKGYLKTLHLPNPHHFIEEVPERGYMGSSSMRRIGAYLTEVFDKNSGDKNFRIFSPDETYSNKFDEVFTKTSRSWNRGVELWDKDLSPEGRVTEMLSEHTLQGMMQGYLLTGRHALFASYEAFVQIVASMSDQYMKFLRVARETSWRGDVGSFVYILTSSGWRQEHNGFSHQNPGFIDNILSKNADFATVYFPCDGGTAVYTMERALESKNTVSVICAGKTVEPRWLTAEESKEALEKGLYAFPFLDSAAPHLVFSAAGEYLTKETIAGIEILQNLLKGKVSGEDLAVRFVSILSLNSKTKNKIEDGKIFGETQPVFVNFHGYPSTMEKILFDAGLSRDRFDVRGYIEHGSTTTPLDLHMRNKTSRYDVVLWGLHSLLKKGLVSESLILPLIASVHQEMKDAVEYAKEHSLDKDSVTLWVYGKTN